MWGRRFASRDLWGNFPYNRLKAFVRNLTYVIILLPALARAAAAESYRMGYEDNPPNMVVGADGTLSGLAIDTVREAARRANLPLQWVRYEGYARPLMDGRADLWPLMADLPERRGELHLTDPWLQSRYMFLFRAGGESPAVGYRGRIGRYAQELHGILVNQQFPQARQRSYPTRETLVEGLCRGEVDAALVEERVAARYLAGGEGPAPPCAVQATALAGVFVQFAIASTPAARAAADRIRAEIGEMAKDGTLALYLTRYVNSGVHDATAAFSLAEAQQRARRLEFLAAALMVVLVLVLWQNRRMRAARQLAEQSRELLKASETRFRTLLVHAADLIAVIDPTGVPSYVSPSCPDVLGWRVHDLMQKNLLDLLHPEDRPRFEETIATLPMAADLPTRVTFRLLHRQNDYRTFQALVRRLPASDPPAGVLINGRDITMEARLQEQLQQSQKMEAVGRLAGGIAHDFNNLLTVINGYSGMLVRRGKLPEAVLEDLTEIHKAGQRAAALTQQLLAFSRRQAIAPRPIDLNESVREMLDMLQRLMGEDVSIETTFDPWLSAALLDPDQIHQVIMNLAVNARDAMPHGGKLRIETRTANVGPEVREAHPEVAPGKYVSLVVADTGAGMDPATLRSIFEPFFTTKGKGEGTGLGLATVHGIVRQSNGWIWASSEPGKGARFTMYFPAIEAKVREAPAEVAASPAPSPAGGQTVLVVEDQGEVRALMQEVLEQQGYRVLTAGSGEAALAVAQENLDSIHLLVTDVVLPGMTGPQLAETIRSLKAGLQVLYTSGYTDNVVVRRGLLDPAFQYLPKPFTPEGLVAKVCEILRSGVC